MLLEIAKVLTLIGVSVTLITYFKKISPSKELIIVTFFILSRLAFSSFHQITFTPLFAGLSPNSVHSLLFCAIFYLYLPGAVTFFKSNLLVSLIIGFMIISALINGTITSSIVSITKWILLGELILLFYVILHKNAPHELSITLVIVYLYPILLLLISILLGESKASEADGSASYVGGFNHEAVFSMIILSALAITVFLCYIFKLPKPITLGIFFAYLILLNFVNYRTTLLASLIMLIALLLAYFKRNSFAWLGLLCIILAAPILASSFSNSAIAERFESLPQAVSVIGELINAPELFYKEEKKLLSGRLYIWSEYVTYVNEGNQLKQWVGHGMDSWNRIFVKYAHNTFISFYFELGIIGLFLIALLFGRQYQNALKIPYSGLRIVLIGFLSSFVLLNLATMPLWAIEGIFLFAYICASILFFSQSAEKQLQYERVSDN